MHHPYKESTNISTLSIVSITLDTAEMGRMNRSNTEMTISDIYYKELIMTSSIIQRINKHKYIIYCLNYIGHSRNGTYEPA